MADTIQRHKQKVLSENSVWTQRYLLAIQFEAEMSQPNLPYVNLGKQNCMQGERLQFFSPVNFRFSQSYFGLLFL